MNKIQTQAAFITALEEVYKNNVDISRKKNADYANSTDPFSNFRLSEHLGVSAEKAIVVRMSDKLARIANLLDNNPAVAQESVLDACSDLCNYAAILRVYIESKV